MAGGKRKGAGRPPGAVTQKTREFAAQAITSGLTPLDFMLSVLRDEAETREKRLDAAKSAAPYIHPRLSAVESKVQLSGHEALLDQLK